MVGKAIQMLSKSMANNYNCNYIIPGRIQPEYKMATTRQANSCK